MTRITMTQRHDHVQNTLPPAKLLPLAALMLAGSLSAPHTFAQEASEKTLKAVTVKEKAEVAEGKDSVRATETTIGLSLIHI